VTGPRRADTRARIWAAATAAAGAWTLLSPRTVARAVSGGGRVPDTAVLMILGGRQLAQGTVLLIRPTPTLLIGAATVDALHAATMLAAALMWPDYRNAAIASATVAGTSAGVGMLILGTARRPPAIR